jgi:recombination protein RecR
MVVARDSDFESIEKSGAYKGLYFILGGTIPILDKEPERRVRVKALTERVAAGMVGMVGGADRGISGGASVSGGLKEIILSLSTTPEGENTADLVRHNIVGLAGFEASKIKISFLARGLSTGAELEYADRETIKNALFNRH